LGVDCSFIDNQCHVSSEAYPLIGYGGAIYARESSLWLLRCDFDQNAVRNGDVGEGGAISSADGSLTRQVCVLRGNYVSGADKRGGAISARGDQLTMRNCVVADNAATSGAGVYYSGDAKAKLRHCTIYENSAQSDAGGILLDTTSSARLTNCVLWGNVPAQAAGGAELAIDYSVVQGGAPGTGNIDENPRLAPQRRDFPLPPERGSPCIDAGDPGFLDAISDWHPRWPRRFPDAPRSDIGAYGGPGNYLWLGGESIE